MGKQLYLLCIAAVFFCAFVSCAEEPAVPTTFVVFDNTRGICPAVVYSDYRRNAADKIAEVPAGKRSDPIECLPGDVTFFFEYPVTIKGIADLTVPYVPTDAGKNQESVRVDANRTTSVSIPKLDETLSSRYVLLSSEVYLFIRNDAASSIRLFLGGAEKKPDGSGSAFVNPGERVLYTISPGAASGYQLMVSGDFRPLPNPPANFESGHVYSFVYTAGGGVTLLSDVAIQLDNVALAATVGTKEHPYWLTENVWANADGTYWFAFTATSSAQFIHAQFGTLKDIYVQVYNSSGAAVGSEARLSGSTTSVVRTLIAGQHYSVRVRPYSSSGSGTHQLVFNTSIVPPDTTVTALAASIWTDGNSTAAGNVQWFSLTATAAAQHIHVDFGTLDAFSGGVNVWVYTGSGTVVVAETRLYGGTRSLRPVLTIGQTYYVRVAPYVSGGTGTYKIGFTASSVNPDGAAELDENIWASGSVTSGGVQWFRFTSTAVNQYIHINVATLYLLVVDGSGTEVGFVAGGIMGGQTKPLVIGQTYYVRVRPSSASGSGEYRISFNTLPLPPDAAVAALVESIWTQGSVTSGEIDWFQFTATSASQYIHAEFGTLADVYAQLYDSGGNAIESEARLSGSTTSLNHTLTIGQQYYIRVRPASGSGTYKIAFNSSIAPPDTLAFPEKVWTNGDVAATGGGQWFVFTATSSAQYIHTQFGTLNDINVQVYDSSSNTIESEARLSGSTTSLIRTLIIGQQYYIRVRTASGSGTYKIAFNSSIAPPDTLAFSEKVWTNGDVAAAGQWFVFTATSSAQYIHTQFGTLNDINVQVYDSSSNTVGSEARLSGSTTSLNRTLTIGQQYYIRVRPASGSGTYKIAFNSSIAPPETVPLSIDTWVNGNIAASVGTEWFSFTATANTQYIHTQFGTLNDINVQVYDSSSNTVGSETRLSGSTTSLNRTLTIGQQYYIRVRPASGSGAYKIAFNTLIAPPGTIPLTTDMWADGNIAASGGTEWFSFTATANTQYIHAAFGSLADLRVQVYTSSGNAVGTETRLYSSTRYFSCSITSGQVFYIRVRPSSSVGSYKITFNTTSTAALPQDLWTNGNITTVGGEQWFAFTATAATQYIHFQFGTLKNFLVQVYDSSSNPLGNEINVFDGSVYMDTIICTLTPGQQYLIRARTFALSAGGTFQITFTTSYAPPAAIALTADAWRAGSIASANGVQWFRFTATAATHTIYVNFGTLTELWMQVYDSRGQSAGSGYFLYSLTSRSFNNLTIGQEYCIQMMAYSSSATGTYSIRFN